MFRFLLCWLVLKGGRENYSGIIYFPVSYKSTIAGRVSCDMSYSPNTSIQKADGSRIRRKTVYYVEIATEKLDTSSFRFEKPKARSKHF